MSPHARARPTKPSTWPFFRHFTKVSFISLLLLSLSVLEFGFDNSITSLVQVMDQFDVDFHMYLPLNETEPTHHHGTRAHEGSHSNSSSNGTHHHGHPQMDPVKLSIFGSIGTPFRAGMLFVALLIAERWGRWAVFVVMQFGSLLGATILFTAHSFVQVVCGRVVLTMFSGWHDWLIPMYLAEIVPGPVRGSVIAFYMIFSYSGSVTAALATFFCSRAYVDDARQYRIPFALMWITPAVCLSLCWVLPESPRWLVRKGRMDDAARALRRLNGTKNGYSPEEEAKLLLASIEEDAATQGAWRDLFRGTNTRRTLIVFMSIFIISFTGQSFVTKYGTIFVKGIGAMDPLQFGLMEKSLSIIAPLTLLFVIDRFGRRTIYFVNAVVYAVCLFLIGGIGMMDVHRVGNVIITLYILSAIVHIIGYHGACTVVAAETPHLRLRERTLTVTHIASNIVEFGVSFSLPYLLYKPYADLESKVGFIYGTISILGIVWGYFYLPDTSKRSLEELEELWQAGVPAYKFGSYKTTGSGVGFRVTQLERHAGAGELGSSSEDLPQATSLRGTAESGKADSDILDKGVAVVHEEVVVPEKV
ncbi:hypothetical protein HMPREF1624_01903 [Sporothrix schenckii ATCC 58251]|uniref:Major facilitator superfamily (MFS) profile domain-containing protein n=1 Tax=Sporothrix schenckii (strain ATCC 58251 / de Perez 2211183) TaxID=1391915 RepID=U7PYJ5_SPOS1|nr:hypothetical protein HMPREF1624_01903 [Sporothrix schenckii ATCC 58251]